MRKLFAAIFILLVLPLCTFAAYAHSYYSAVPLGAYTNTTQNASSLGFNGGTNNITATSTNYYGAVVVTNISTASYYTNVPDTNAFDNQIGIYSTKQQVAVTNTILYTNYPTVLDLTMWGEFGFYISFNLDGAGTSAVKFNLDTSPDNIHWSTNAVSLSITAAGTTSVNLYTNLTAASTGFYRLSSGANANASNVTNLTIIPDLKPNRYGPVAVD